MGDGGLCVGASALCENQKQKLRSKKLNSYYLGFGYSNKEILSEITKFKLKKIFVKNQTNIIAKKKLHQGKIIAVFQGKSEFGPRSLGNRSILVKTVNKNINKSLNSKLGRTEFMPFAPITIDKYANKMYTNYKKNHYNSKIYD